MLILLLLISSVFTNSIPTENLIKEKDLNTFSNYEDIIHTHIHTEIHINFNEKTLQGSANYKFRSLKPNINRIILDLKKIEILRIEENNVQLDYQILEIRKQHPLGTPLEIKLNRNLDMNEEINIKIHFITKKSSDAIQWLNKEQTIGKKHPYLFTQGEAILSRTIFPNQDTPSVKSTFSAIFTVDSPLTVVFSGKLVQKLTRDSLNIFSFEQQIPIPSYLYAFVSGMIQFKEISERCGVYAEIEILEKSAKEFEDTEKFIQTAENYLTPYEWGRYDIVVLPIGFPYGGMENPNLTFVTPSLIAGDKSLVNVIAHEISHSWTGNLVTNSNWKNFWLNEGFTVFLERKILRTIYGDEVATISAIEGYEKLVQTVSSFPGGHSFASLSPDVSEIDPDDAFSLIPYEKGFLFLTYIEKLVGENFFQNFLRKYVRTFRLKSITYKDFRKLFEDELDDIFGNEKSTNIKKQIDWNHWVFESGVPNYKPNYKSKLIDEARNLAEKFLSGRFDHNDKLKFNSFISSLKVIFLNFLEAKSDNMILKNISDFLELNSSQNCEVTFKWFELVFKKNFLDSIPFVCPFLSIVGRMKYLRPIYKEFYRFNHQEASYCFNMNKKLYHPVAVRLIENDFNSINNYYGLSEENIN